jgi:hypothetical protein
MNKNAMLSEWRFSWHRAVMPSRASSDQDQTQPKQIVGVQQRRQTQGIRQLLSDIGLDVHPQGESTCPKRTSLSTPSSKTPCQGAPRRPPDRPAGAGR